jgi:tetratricopeptide (TPR) repeat protein
MVQPSARQRKQGQRKDARAYNQQAIGYLRQGKLRKARACIHEALRLQPDFPNAHVNLGNIFFCQEKYDGALHCYEQALHLNPDFAEASNNRGNALAALGRYEEALAACQRALRLKPDTALFYQSLGNIYKCWGKLDDAVACAQQALTLDPQSHEAHNNLGVALVELNRFQEAAGHYREALRLKPDFPEVYRNLGVLFMTQFQWEDALMPLCRAIQLRPRYPEAYCDLAYALGQLGKHPDAARCFREVVRLKPNYAEAHLGLAFNLLLRGHFKQAWPDYEWRLRINGSSPRSFPQPLWDGSPLGGRTILLHAEGGLGDTIQFIRYAKVVKQSGGTVIVECQELLLPFLASCPGIDRLVAAKSELPAFDVHAPLLSLPLILKTSLATVPADIPYLGPDAGRHTKWQRKLDRYPGFKVGIVWQGNPRFLQDRQRSIPLVHFAPLAQIEGVCLLSLQKGPGSEQLGAVAEQFRVIDLGCRLDKKGGAFMDTAAVMKNLDLVITSDTAIAHLAGALGVPVWVALSFAPDWRWLLRREDSPWYPTMRLFRQTKSGDWDGVFARMAEALPKKVAASRGPGPVAIKVAPGELIDKITILEIKRDKIPDDAKLRHVQTELQALQAVRERDIQPSSTITRLTAQLKRVNQRLWQVEDEIRLCEQAKDFGPRFIQLARSVYRLNDLRATLKSRISDTLGSTIIEVKHYPTWRRDSTGKGVPSRLRNGSARHMAERPDEAKAYNQQAATYLRQGKLRKARACIHEALRLKPDFPNAHVNLGNIHFYQRRYAAALDCYDKALHLNPDFAEAANNRGNALAALGRYEEALAACQHALRLKPDTALFYQSLGNIYKCWGKLDEAVACAQQALTLDPQSHEAHNNLGAALVELNRFEEAAVHYREALRLKPDFPEVYYNLGNLSKSQWDWDAALVLLSQAIRLRPKYPEAYYDLGHVLGRLGKHHDAARCFCQALHLKPDFAEAHYAYAFNLLLRGRYPLGWRELEWRWRHPQYSLRPLPQPLWDGSPLAGRTILLHSEWALGDTLQVIRYARVVKQSGGTVIVQCQKSLLPLLASCPGIDRLVAHGSPLPAFDVHAPFMSLPRILKTTLDTVPADIPYLFADAVLQRKWRRTLSRFPGFKIGIVWYGSSANPYRAIPLTQFAPLARVPGVHLISLQKGPGAEQLEAVADQFRVINLGSHLDERSGAFMDTAAIMKNLDLVITCDTSSAHLAGALAVPVWVALGFVADWRWLLEREDSPWYPTMRLDRQIKPGDWDGVFARMAEALSKRMATGTVGAKAK